MCMSVLPAMCVCMLCACLVPAEAKRGCHQISGELKLRMVVNPNMGTENRTWVLLLTSGPSLQFSQSSDYCYLLRQPHPGVSKQILLSLNACYSYCSIAGRDTMT